MLDHSTRECEQKTMEHSTMDTFHPPKYFPIVGPMGGRRDKPVAPPCQGRVRTLAISYQLIAISTINKLNVFTYYVIAEHKKQNDNNENRRSKILSSSYVRDIVFFNLAKYKLRKNSRFLKLNC